MLTFIAGAPFRLLLDYILLYMPAAAAAVIDASCFIAFIHMLTWRHTPPPRWKRGKSTNILYVYTRGYERNNMLLKLECRYTRTATRTFIYANPIVATVGTGNILTNWINIYIFFCSSGCHKTGLFLSTSFADTWKTLLTWMLIFCNSTNRPIHRDSVRWGVGEIVCKQHLIHTLWMVA